MPPGVVAELALLGCAKSWLIGDHAAPGPAAGESVPLTVGDETVGAVMRSAADAKPVYVSPGHRIDLASAMAVVRATLSGFRHPTPTREAHMAANALRRTFRVPS